MSLRVLARLRHADCIELPYWKGLGADSEEKHEPVSDIDTVVVDSLKVLDPKWPIREADSSRTSRHVRKVPTGEVASPHSINSLALVSKVWGTVRPRAFAVLRLMISS